MTSIAKVKQAQQAVLRPAFRAIDDQQSSDLFGASTTGPYLWPPDRPSPRAGGVPCLENLPAALVTDLGKLCGQP
ncbi:hypothetical protein GCM10010211_82430 [Streptomyces albospinus]|uniref:Uncharacterized protein n=1 Tax=Streptomyces albospinus TaxID=285515 RepID=A0ABQ2VRY9_9ACTN|nr:hypothetical protein GCM10010211_82430 [Streptomyces albospinus]